MIRTQVSIDKIEYQMAKKEARRLGISLAELLRRSLRRVLPLSREKPWMKYAGLVESGNPNASMSIDNIIYGQKH